MNSRVPFSMQPGLGLSFIFVCLWVPNCTSNTGCKLGSPSSDCFYASVKDRLEIVTSVCFQALCSSESICVMGHTVLMTPALEEVFRPGGMISFALFFLNTARVIFFSSYVYFKSVAGIFNKQEKITSWDLDRNYLTLTCPSRGSWHLLSGLVG